MTKALAIDCSGGLDQESSNLEITPGRVRESLNYEALPMGGYRRVDGHAPWSGSLYTPDFQSKAVQYVEVTTLPAGLQEFSFGSKLTSVLGVRFTILGYLAVFTNGLVSSYYVAVDLENERRRLAVDDIMASASNEVVRVLRTEVVLTEAQFTSLVDNSFASTLLSPKPDGDGRINLLINLGDRLFALRQQGANSTLSDGAPGFGIGVWNVFFPGVPLQASDQWDHDVYQFANRTEEAYIVNGVDHIVWAFSQTAGGTTIDLTATPLNLSPAGPAPSQVIVFKEHLFLAIGTSLVHSNIGDPTTFDAATGGAGEIRIGRDITGLEVLPGNALAVFTDETIDILYGTSSADWRLERYSREIGALEGTVQQLPATIFWDRRGIQMLEATDAYGDFSSNTLSHGFHDLFERMKGDRLFSTVNRAKSQYRVFNASGRGIYLTFNNRNLVGAMEIDLKLDSRISCMGTRKNTRERDDNFIGLEDGTVLRTDFGPSFSGKPIDSSIKFAFVHGNNPVQKKRWRLARFHMTGDSRTTLQGRGEMEYGIDFYSDNRVEDMQIETGRQTRVQDDSNAFVWDHDVSLEGRLYLEGSSTSLGVVVKQESASLFPHVIHNQVIQYTDRGVVR